MAKEPSFKSLAPNAAAAAIFGRRDVYKRQVQENQEVTGMELSERRQRILAAIVEQFIASGEPVRILVEIIMV